MNEREIFTVALQKQGAAQRAAFLAEACGDGELRQRVESLLAEHDRLGSFLEYTAAPAEPPGAPLECSGTRIGPYKLLQRIGEGGMGVVYMAEQTEPVRRRVALKIIRPGMDTRQVIARFEAERHALSLMDHPNIAKVLDAGTTEEGDRDWRLGTREEASTASPPRPLAPSPASGRPYFVMELVKGVPITQFCDERKLPLRERLKLFVTVCQAIQHAHQKGIIHRDIKPTNVLIAEYDEQAMAKIIDFGVAKAVGWRLTERTMFTEFGQLIGTLEYMSPEQAKLNQLDIDTRSDVYSLGVLLYELLTGTTPLDRKRLNNTSLLELLRIVREQDAPTLSNRLNTTEELPAIAASRGLEAAKLTKLVRGELDWIVAKALEKDRKRRYETASALAADVRHYLNDDPVVACPPSATYRLRKFGHRYRLTIGVAAGFLSLLVAGAAVSTYQAIRIGVEQTETLSQKQEADRQRKAAEQNERLAEQRLAEGLAATGDALLASREVLRARSAYEKSIQISDKLGLSPMAAMTGLVQSYIDSPPALLPFYQPPSYPLNGRSAHIAFSPDGRTVAITGDGLHLWDAVIGTKIGTLRRQGPVSRGIEFSHDGTMLSTSDADGTARIWDVASRAEIHRLPGHTGQVYDAVFTPDDRRVVTGGAEGEVAVWDVHTGQVLRRMKHGGEVWAVAISPDGSMIASGGGPRELKVWNANTGELIASADPPDGGPIESAAFSPDGTAVLMGHRGKYITLWNLTEQSQIRAFGPLDGYTMKVDFFHDGTRFVSTGDDGIVRVWDVATGTQLHQYAAVQNPFLTAALSPDNRCVVTGDYRLWSLSDETDAFSIAAHTAMICRCAVSPDGRFLLTGDSQGTLKLWDIATWKTLLAIAAHDSGIESLCFAGDSWRVLTAGRDEIRLWDLRTGKATREYLSDPIRNGSERGAVAAPDGRTAVIRSGTHEVQLLDLESGNTLQTLQQSGFPYFAAFSPDGKGIITGDSTWKAVLWDASTGRPIRTLKGHDWFISCAAFSSTGKMALTGSWDCNAILWDIQTGKLRHVLRGHTGHLKQVRISTNGQTAFTTAEDGTLRLWDISSGKQLRVFSHGFRAPVRGLAIIENDTLVTGDSKGTLRIWRLDWPNEMRERTERLAKAQEILGRNPDDAGALREIGEWYVFRGKWDWALELLERAKAGGAQVSALTLARCYWKAGRADDAERLLTQAAQAGEAPADYLRMCRDAARRSETAHGSQGLAALPRPSEVAAIRVPREPKEVARAIVRLEDNATWNSPRKAACRRLAMREDLFNKVAELQPGETTLWIARAQYHVLGSRWSQAAADYAKVIDARPVYDEFVEYGHLLLLLGDVTAYRQLCEKLSARQGEPRDTYSAYVMARTCAAGPECAVDSSRVVQWAEEGVKDSRAAWRLHALGLALYRAGDLQKSIVVLDESNRRPDWGQPTYPQNWFVLAMAHHRLGQAEESRRCLEEGRRGMALLRPDRPVQRQDVDAPEWAAMHALEQEAETMLAATNGLPTRSGTTRNEVVQEVVRVEQSDMKSD